MAMTPDRYPRLFELAPGIGAALGYSGRGICTATILGAELARWAAGEAGIDALAMPASSFRTLPYYALRGIIVDSAVNHIDPLEAPGRFHKDESVLNDQISTDDNFDPHRPR